MLAAKPLCAAEFGVKCGANLSFGFQSTNAVYNIEYGSSLFGVKAGFFAAFPLGKNFSLQPEINYAGRGVRYYSASQRGLEPARFHYLEIPLLANLAFKGKKLFFFIGPYYAILLGSTPVDSKHDWTWMENRLKNSDGGLIAGFRWRLQAVFVELQYSLGLENVMDNSNPLSPFQPDHKNHCAALLIGYVF